MYIHYELTIYVIAVFFCINFTNSERYITRVNLYELVRKPHAERLCFRAVAVVAVGDGDDAHLTLFAMVGSYVT